MISKKLLSFVSAAAFAGTLGMANAATPLNDAQMDGVSAGAVQITTVAAVQGSAAASNSLAASATFGALHLSITPFGGSTASFAAGAGGTQIIVVP